MYRSIRKSPSSFLAHHRAGAPGACCTRHRADSGGRWLLRKCYAVKTPRARTRGLRHQIRQPRRGRRFSTTQRRGVPRTGGPRFRIRRSRHRDAVPGGQPTPRLPAPERTRAIINRIGLSNRGLEKHHPAPAPAPRRIHRRAATSAATPRPSLKTPRRLPQTLPQPYQYADYFIRTSAATTRAAKDAYA